MKSITGLIKSFSKNKIILGLFLLMAPVAFAQSTVDPTSVVYKIGGIESGNNYSTNIGNGALGAYQLRTVALQQNGYKDASGNWTGKDGITSTDQFLGCAACQTNVENNYLHDEWNQLQANGSTSYVGQTGKNGLVYNEGALLECGNYLGPKGCNDYLTGNLTQSDIDHINSIGGEDKLIADMALASEGNTSAITGGYTQVDNTGLAQGGTLSTSSAAAQMFTACAQEIQKMMNQASEAQIDSATTMAGMSATGYTLMNGRGIMDDIVANGGNMSNPGGSASDTSFLNNLGGSLSGSGYRVAGCLDNMINQITGPGAIFLNKPDLDGILSQLTNMACSAMQQQFSNLVQPAYKLVGDVNSNLSIGGGGFLPGMQIGSVGLSSGNSSYVNSLLNNDPSWYNGPNSSLNSALGYTPGQWNAGQYLLNNSLGGVSY